MKKFFLLFFFFTTHFLSAQKLDSFSLDTRSYLSELDIFMTSSGNKIMKDLFDDFEKRFQSGVFTSEEQQRVFEMSNKMLNQKMTARPYFENYVRGLMVVNNAENGAVRFREWHTIMDEIIANIKNRKLKPFSDFLKFSAPFFEDNAIKSSKKGVSWFADSDNPKMKTENGIPIIEYEKLNLFATRKTDTITIFDTKGTFYPASGIWKGEGGRVPWQRFGLDDVFADLGTYEIEVKSALYKVAKVEMTYPLFFGSQTVVGSFEDKLVAANAVTDGSYPRFESEADVLNIENIGEGIGFRGGFRLQGTTIYGFGSKENPAWLTVKNIEGKQVYKGFSQLFTIRKGERIVGERVKSSIYIDEDSLFHPSVNLRFEIPENELKLSRGKRASDRNPFYSSMHEVNIDASSINYYIGKDTLIIGEKNLGIKKSPAPVVFESLQFFDEGDYRRIQSISTSNPLAIIRAVAEREGNILSAHDLATKLNSKYEVENIKTLLYDLVAQGFINYDSDEQLVEIKEKVFHYANASNKKVDFDALQLISETKETNATFDLKSKLLETTGVESIEFSRHQKVALQPYGKTVYLGNNRNMDFSGKLYAGYATFQGKDFHFDYDKFSIDLDSVRYFDLFIPTGAEDEDGNKEALSIASRIEHLSGVLLIDAPENKSGREEIPMFPSIQSKKPSYVYYDKKETQGGIYTRDSFYFELKPFSLNSLDQLGPLDVKFKGNLISFDIFSDIEETLVVNEEDQSLGFETKTPDKGLSTYLGKGNYRGLVKISDKGLEGQGVLNYLQADVDSEDLIFKPKNTTGSAERFNLEEERTAGNEIPQMRGFNVKVNWRPYQDSMYVSSKEAPFELFKDDQHTLKGIAILTPEGLKGKGLFDWPKASMSSSTFSFGAHSVVADTSDLKIRAFNAEDLALTTNNLNAIVDFDEQKGTFKANDEFLTTALPYNKYETSFNEFDWDINNEIITFKAKEGLKGNFLSVHPDQDSLKFEGDAASYNLKTSELNITGVDYIVSADAFIYPDSGLVDVLQGGKMSYLKNARIEADTINKYHVINKAEIQINGKKDFSGNGFYEYNIGDVKQEIRFDEIKGTRIGKGSRAKKATATRATGEVTAEDNFLIDHKTEYRGSISLFSESVNLKFEGYARLKSSSLTRKEWFTVAFDGDKSNLAIKYDVPKNYQAEPLRTGLYLSKENSRIYGSVMAPLFFRKDRPILPVTGYMKYDRVKDQFIFGDSLKILSDGYVGNKLTYFEETGVIKGEGKFNIGEKLKYVSIQSAGRSEIAAPSIDTTQFVEQLVTADLMMGINLLLPDELKKMLVQDFQSASFDAQPINFADGTIFYKKATAELFGIDNKDTQKAIESLSQGIYDIPKRLNKYDFLFTKVPLKWDPDYQSFVSTKEKIGIASIDGQMLNKDITCYIEAKMPTKDDDRIYIYLKSPSDLYYFFGFKQGILNIVSNNTKFNDFVVGMKEKDRITKMPDGETFEIQPVNPGTANSFVSRVKAAAGN